MAGRAAPDSQVLTVDAAVRMYATRWCPYCVSARRLLDSLGVRFEEIDVGGRPDLRAEMEHESGRYTVPQIWIGSRHVGGFDDLDALNRRGLLVPMLEQASSGVHASSE